MTAANRYAKALFALAQEGKTQPAVTNAVTALVAALEDPTIASALSNPRLTPAQRKQIADSMAKAVKAPQPLANTLGLLAASNRLAIIPAVLASFLKLNDTASGITHVKLASAEPLTDAQRTKISDLIKKHTQSAGVRFEETVDATLKGGFRAFFNGKVWDASLSGQLARLSSTLRTTIAQRQNQR